MPCRLLKGNIRTSRKIAALKTWQARCLFYHLIVTVDDFGCFDGRPEILLAECFPLLVDVITWPDMIEWLEDLERVGLLVRYECEGKPYIALPKWFNHQRLRKKFRKWPRPPDEKDNLLPPVEERSEEGNEEGEKKEGKKEKKPKRKLPDVSGDAQKLAEEFYGGLGKVYPRWKEFNLTEDKLVRRLTMWGAEVDRMIRLDGRSVADIRTVIQFVVSDTEDKHTHEDWPGWALTCHSMSSLREKFDDLLAKARRETRSGTAKFKGKV